VEVVELYDVADEADDDPTEAEQTTHIDESPQLADDDMGVGDSSQIVTLHIEPAADVADEPEHDGAIAPVVALFAGEIDPPHVVDDRDGEPDASPAAGKGSVDDLFAKLRAARADAVVSRATTASRVDIVEVTTLEAGDVTTGIPVLEFVDVDVTTSAVRVPDATQELAVFRATEAAPVVEIEHDDSVFGQRDAALTPLIVAGARKLKRVLADEQNDVLHALRSAKALRSLDDLLPREEQHVRAYADAIHDELVAAALAGAASTDPGGRDHRGAVTKADALRPAVQALGSSIVQPLRERLDRAVHDVDGDAQELATIIRAIYREWKTQRIDEHLDDVARTAFGRGAYVVLTPGTPICWVVDPNGPACPDAEDNSLAGVVNAGDPVPTDHRCAPAHDGCRCMLQPAPR
jgi:hypothetical protein